MENKTRITTEPKLGAPQVCPECGGQNPSGTWLPRDCRWCSAEGEDTAAIKPKRVATRKVYITNRRKVTPSIGN